MSRLAEFSEARDIYQAHLDDISNAIMADDFATLLDGLSFPLTLYREDGEVVVDSSEDMKSLFTAYRRTLMAQGVTEYVRIALSAEFLTPDTICGQHLTHIMRDGLRLVEPYKNRVRLRRIDGGWYECASASAVKCDSLRMLLPKPGRSADAPLMPSINTLEDLGV